MAGGGGGASPSGTLNGAVARRPWAGAALREWLGGVDWSVGTLSCYVDFLKENFDSPEQLSEIYSKSRPDGRRAFDLSQFFEDVGIEDPAHKRFFESWFAPAGSGSPEPPASPAHSPTAPAGAAPAGGGAPAAWGRAAEEPRSPAGRSQLSGSAAASPSEGPRAGAARWRFAQPAASTPTAASAASSAQGTPSRGLRVEDWLGSVDWSAGVLMKYRRQFEETFDDPALYPHQIRDAYVVQSGDRQVFDEASFFGDLGIEDPSHRELFRAWFAEQFGAVGALS